MRTAYGFRRFNEDFCLAELELGRIHVDGIHDDFDAGTRIASPRGPRLLADDRVPARILQHTTLVGSTAFSRRSQNGLISC